VVNVSSEQTAFDRALTHARDPLRVCLRVETRFQHFNRNVAAFMLTLPDAGVPASMQRGIREVTVKWDFRGSWNQSLATAYLAQGTETLLLELWR
jgi:hypothetical protein